MSEYTCGFCGRSFRSERTLTAHLCVQKRRYRDRHTQVNQQALTLYQRFYELNTVGRSTKTFDDFVRSQYYKAFVKLARHLQDLRPVEPERYADWLFQNNIKERQWCADRTYEQYVVYLLGSENPQRALERSIVTMDHWCSENTVPLAEFFVSVPGNTATQMIRYGRLSPWVLYLADSSDHLWNRLTEEQADIIAAVIDPQVWRRKLETQRQHREFVKQMLDEAQL